MTLIGFLQGRHLGRAFFFGICASISEVYVYF